MIQNSINHTDISYQLMQKNTLDFNTDTFDIITFAGSLFYAKYQEILNETIRVSKPNCKIIVYDFEVLMEDVFKALGVCKDSFLASDYNHETNFTGLKTDALQLLEQTQKSVEFEISISDLAHLLLSAKNDYSSIAAAYKYSDLYNEVVQQLKKQLNTGVYFLKANTYLTAYSVLK
ncbi:hypothetical protein QSV08_06210 [Maribacter sp. BPC-D8]|uniref:hypothetical protein n=1 Tax=Maribacter sp. BPC-D8 TaxID=3053613 RepID=UPI002B48442D|nr:hypothetical protein [Maribacter sp. BPC-D8]WRI30836.1 hypothetical protein QSV08_06210 [Maribacter sp. BPC-D8]